MRKASGATRRGAVRALFWLTRVTMTHELVVTSEVFRRIRFLRAESASAGDEEEEESGQT